jgi:propionyl-CoA synthetase
MSAGQVWLTSSELSSVVAHSGLVYAPLFAGVTSVLYEGLGATDAGAIWRLVADHNVEGVLAAADLVGAVQDEDREGNAMRPEQPSALRHVFLAGGHLDLDNDDWASQVLGVPVTHTWWQNEFGWPLVTMRGLEPLSDTTGSASQPWPGCDLRILDERGEELPPGRTGSICVRLPLPPGAMTAPWGDEERRVSAPPVSYDGYYRSCCCGYRDEDGYVSVTGAMPPL